MAAIEIDKLGIGVGLSLGLARITNSVKQELSITDNSLTQNITNLYSYVDTLNEVQETAAKASDSLLSVASGIGGFVSTIAGYIGSALESLDGLKSGQDSLGVVSESDVTEAQRYEKAMDGLDKMLEAVKVRVALGIAPQLSYLAEGFLSLLDANKELIAAGLSRTMEIVGEGLDALVNFGRAVDAVVQSTVGWEATLMMLGAALAWVGQATILAFAANPVTWIVAALIGLIVLVDDFMTYLDGGESALGEFWAPFKTGLEGINETLAAFKAVFAAFWAENGETVTAFGNDLFTIIGASVMQLVAIFQMFFAAINGDFEGVKAAFSSWFEALKAQFEIIGGFISKAASYIGLGGEEEGEAGATPQPGPGRAMKGPGTGGLSALMANGPGLVDGASQLSAGVQGAQSQAAAGVGVLVMPAQPVSNSYSQTVTVSVAGDNPREIGREVAEQVARNQQRLTTHNNSSEIRQ
ncbi:hypothetical protein thsps21_16850 [Pseudomonas sp. No.21]|uniref:hypothetical protein n=1 Tax=Pseudomonas TaxID=286 RepID=UPI000DA97494|nr:MULTISPECIES: hypothetical protein [Pseudomonas]MDW3710690.1 hypothetical protein [Pseudomonas sp. 2023EL-01195]PZE12529.1 hypothetical protein DMX10_15385 [Pseudomonas sp. 57B-090624]GJN49135.1 hypothetical protein TUM20249_51210 [Pseudomonas tohonis]